MKDFSCGILRNEALNGSYWRAVFRAPELALESAPGQFVNVRIPVLNDRILRRPFSVCDADPVNGTITLVYKIAGAGTKALSRMSPGEKCDLLGPLGRGYTLPGDPSVTPLLVAGGCGGASTFFLAKQLKNKGILLTGARTKEELLLADEYRLLGCQVMIATDDGSCGHHGLVTDLLSSALESCRSQTKIYGCGPGPMLYALGKCALAFGVPCELSLEQHMCCGVGACYACVVKVKDPANPGAWTYSRSCKEGPVYNAEELYYG